MVGRLFGVDIRQDCGVGGFDIGCWAVIAREGSAENGLPSLSVLLSH